MKSLLFTGSNGFLGRNIIPLLNNNFNITTIDIKNANINCNLSTKIPDLSKTNYQVVFHAAGKAHLTPKNEEEVQSFYNTNYYGTINLCKGLEKYNIPKSFIFISTVAVYGCEFGENLSEDIALNGKTPYALSKIKAEEYLKVWCKKHDVILTILRPSLIAGPKPPGNLGNMIQGIRKGFYFNINNGNAKKSILMVEDLANLIPLVENKGGIFNICDDEQPTFKDLANLISIQLKKRKPINISLRIAKGFAFFGDLLGNKAPINSVKLNKITNSLTFSNQKAKEQLNWTPLNVLQNFKII